MIHPIQKTEVSADGVIRFRQNAIVRYLLDSGRIDMNQIARADFSREDREQFAMLIGYSLGGFAELDYVSEEVWVAATKMHEDGLNEVEARNEHLRETLETVKQALREPVASLFGIHLDDLP